jgi:hypothetical protein
VTPKATNERDIDPGRKVDPASQKMAYYHASMMPPPNDPAPHPVDRKAAMAAKDLLETPAQALVRRNIGGAKPAHYTPTPAVDIEPTAKRVASPYG